MANSITPRCYAYIVRGGYSAGDENDAESVHLLFSLSFLNNHIANFSYGREESRNKVPKAIERHHVTSPESRLHLSGMFKHVSVIVYTPFVSAHV